MELHRKTVPVQEELGGESAPQTLPSSAETDLPLLDELKFKAAVLELDTRVLGTGESDLSPLERSYKELLELGNRGLHSLPIEDMSTARQNMHKGFAMAVQWLFPCLTLVVGILMISNHISGRGSSFLAYRYPLWQDMVLVPFFLLSIGLQLYMIWRTRREGKLRADLLECSGLLEAIAQGPELLERLENGAAWLYGPLLRPLSKKNLKGSMKRLVQDLDWALNPPRRYFRQEWIAALILILLVFGSLGAAHVYNAAALSAINAGQQIRSENYLQLSSVLNSFGTAFNMIVYAFIIQMGGRGQVNMRLLLAYFREHLVRFA